MSRSPSRSRHSFREHTGEVAMHVEADDLRSLFEEAACGLADLLAEDAGGAPTGPEERVTLRSVDREALLVDRLNELVYRGEVHKRVYAEVHVERVDEHGLEATVRGREPSAPRTSVKAATWHGLRIGSRGAGVEASVVLDV